MGLDALSANGITTKICYLIRDRAMVTSTEPLQRVRRSRILLFVVIQLLGFGATMAITQTIGMSNFLIHLPSSQLPADYEVASRNRISDRNLTTHTFAHNSHPETPVYRGGVGSS